MKIQNRNTIAKVLLCLPLLAAAVCGTANADESMPRKLAFYAVQYTSCAASANGALADACWAQAPAATAYYEYWKPNPAPGALKSEFRMLYNERGIYLKITNYDDHLDKLRASIIRRDDPDLWTDDCAQLYFDPAANGVGFVSFTINSQGVQSDYKQQDAAVMLRDWSGTGWRAAAHQTAGAWIIDAFFPWTDLGKKAAAGDVWMFDHVRYAYTSGKFIGVTWAPGGNYKSTSSFGYLYFMKDKTIAPATVAKVLNAAAPAPWMLPLDDEMIVHPQPGKMEFTTASAMAAAQREALLKAIAQAQNASQNDAKAKKQLAQIEADAQAVSYQSPQQALAAIDQMAALQEQANQIYWQQQLIQLINAAAADK